MADYSNAFACFILECRDAYEDLAKRIDAGEVPEGRAATIRIQIPATAINAIRQERLLLAVGGKDG